MKKLRLRKARDLAWGHRAGKSQNQDLNVFIRSIIHSCVGLQMLSLRAFCVPAILMGTEDWALGWGKPDQPDSTAQCSARGRVFQMNPETLGESCVENSACECSLP